MQANSNLVHELIVPAMLTFHCHFAINEIYQQMLLFPTPTSTVLVVFGCGWDTHTYSLDQQAFIMSTTNYHASVVDRVAKDAASGVKLSKFTPQLIIH